MTGVGGCIGGGAVGGMGGGGGSGKWPGHEEIKMEGKLVKILGIETNVEYADFCSYNTEIKTKILMDVNNVERSIDFYGIVFPDSLNNRVIYSEKSFPHLRQKLTDIDLNREYVGSNDKH